MSALQELRISGWKSIRDARIDFGRITVMIGANGAGKSNLCSFFQFLAHYRNRELQWYWAKNGGAHSLLHYGPAHTEELRFELSLGAHYYRSRLTAAVDGSVFVVGEEINGSPLWEADTRTRSANPRRRPTRSEEIDRLRLHPGSRARREPGIGSEIAAGIWPDIGYFHFEDVSVLSGMRGAAEVREGERLHRDGRNLSAVLYSLQRHHPERFALVENSVRQAVPGFRKFSLANGDGKSSIRWLSAEDDYPLGAHQLSDGTIRWIALCTLLQMPMDLRPSTIVIDEPELGLHPVMLANLAALVDDAAEDGTQIILATQSPYLLNFFRPQDVLTVDHDGRESTFRRHEPPALEGWLHDYTLGELWEKNVLGGQPF